MQKGITILITLLILCLSLAHAEAPELRNVMPSSWKKLTRLSAEEEAKFLEGRAYLNGKSEHEYNMRYYINRRQDGGFPLDYSRVYKQTAGSDTFYRLVMTGEENPDFFNPYISFAQGLIGTHNGKQVILVIGLYNVLEAWQHGTKARFHSIEIIQENEKARGILVTQVAVDINDSSDYSFTSYTKGKIAGRGGCSYYLLETIPIGKAMIGWNTGPYFISGSPEISIRASPFLVDPRMPLRYSLQNAFDNDPSTSYVENTEDDLMKIEVSAGSLIQTVAIINGYAENAFLYQSNNRVKEIANEGVERKETYIDIVPGTKHLLQDSIIGKQYVSKFNGNYIFVTQVFSGTKYDDTCIAELNIQTEKDGWLFGGEGQ